MILADLVKDVSYGNSKRASKFEEEVRNKVEQFENKTNKFIELINTHGNSTIKSSINNSINSLVQEFNDSLSKEREAINFLEMKLSTPIKNISFSTYNNTFTHQLYKTPILEAPRAKMSNILDVAEKLGLLIIPTQYVNTNLLQQDYYKNEHGYTYSVNGIFNKFVSASNENNLNAWMVCPIQYYDIEAHSKNLSYEFFVPNAVRQAFTSIKIILPMLIGMISQIESLSKKVDNMSTELQNIRQTLVQQQQQIDRLQEELTQQRIKIAEQAAKEREMQREFEQARERILWDIFDPLLIAVPSNVTNINNYDGNVVLGPAWGPEIDQVLIDLLGLSKQADRENYTAKEARRYN